MQKISVQKYKKLFYKILALKFPLATMFLISFIYRINIIHILNVNVIINFAKKICRIYFYISVNGYDRGCSQHEILKYFSVQFKTKYSKKLKKNNFSNTEVNSFFQLAELLISFYYF